MEYIQFVIRISNVKYLPLLLVLTITILFEVNRVIDL